MLAEEAEGGVGGLADLTPKAINITTAASTKKRVFRFNKWESFLIEILSTINSGATVPKTTPAGFAAKLSAFARARWLSANQNSAIFGERTRKKGCEVAAIVCPV